MGCSKSRKFKFIKKASTTLVCTRMGAGYRICE
jgi:hypothetical protein